jgi:hypothetical protein
MTRRQLSFEVDGHRFEAVERIRDPGAADPHVIWDVRMDGAPALEFRGEYPYRDGDIEKRVREWYAIQKPRPGLGA